MIRIAEVLPVTVPVESHTAGSGTGGGRGQGRGQACPCRWRYGRRVTTTGYGWSATFGDEGTPDLQDILDALDDPDCRKIVRELDEPMTADDISDRSGVPLSTTYRKLELLTEASLLEEGTEIRPDGQHASRYTVTFEEVVITLDEDPAFEVDILRAPRTADERLANLWSEVRKET